MSVRTGFVYVLHFAEKLSHAEHYIGCTHEPKERLKAHAIGAGSRLCQVLMEKGIEWKLGELACCSHVGMRRIERKLKDNHNARKFCGICTPIPRKIPGTQSYPISLLTFPTDSLTLRIAEGIERIPDVEIIWPTSGVEKGAIIEIVRLMGKERDALGFIPAGGVEGLETLFRRGTVAVAVCSGIVVGYCASTLSMDGMWCNIQQCVTEDAFRLMGIGRKMVVATAAKFADRGLRANVRDDLAANHFWESIGFELTDTKHHRTSKSVINVYETAPMLPGPQGTSIELVGENEEGTNGLAL